VKYPKSLEKNESIEIQGASFAYGRCDGVTVSEAAKEKEAMKFVMETGFPTQYTVETIFAAPSKEM
jgi:hypothetical protein